MKNYWSTDKANFKNTGSGQILETIACMCDGRTVTVPSGSYAITDVTAAQASSTTDTTCTGSEISYTPPAGTKQLVYNYEFQMDTTGYSGLCQFETSVDGTIVLPSQKLFHQTMQVQTGIMVSLGFRQDTRLI